MAEELVVSGFWAALTLGIYLSAARLYRRTSFILLNPVLVTISGLILLLVLAGIPYGRYQLGGRFIAVFLEPSVVALGLPLYLQRKAIAERARAILSSIAIGSVVGVATAVGVTLLLGGSEAVARALAPRSVTTPIAIGISERIGGIPSLTAALVISSGVFGAVFGPSVLRVARVRSRTAFGLAMGAASHGIGTARAVQEGEMEGASSALAIGLMGLATSVAAPVVVGLVARLVLP
jgi:predicted murein hydrolase (TIGR00659 family)